MRQEKNPKISLNKVAESNPPALKLGTDSPYLCRQTETPVLNPYWVALLRFCLPLWHFLPQISMSADIKGLLEFLLIILFSYPTHPPSSQVVGPLWRNVWWETTIHLYATPYTFVYATPCMFGNWWERVALWSKMRHRWRKKWFCPWTLAVKLLANEFALKDYGNPHPLISWLTFCLWDFKEGHLTAGSMVFVHVDLLCSRSELEAPF